MPLRCRYYKNGYPEKDEVVIARITKIEQMGSYAELPEYDNRPGMILHSELSRRRIRSIIKLVRLGREDAVVVIRVDPDMQYIDLSKRRVSADEIALCEERYSKAKTVNQILVHVAEKLGFQTNEQLEELHEKTAWFFDTKAGRKVASYDMFKKAVRLSEVLESIRLSIESFKGTFKIIQAPRVVSDSDEVDLKRQMAELEEVNREVSGDEDDEDLSEEDDSDDDDGEE